MSDDEMRAELERLRQENAALKKGAARGVGALEPLGLAPGPSGIVRGDQGPEEAADAANKETELA